MIICLLYVSWKKVTSCKKEPVVIRTRDRRTKNMTQLRENLLTHDWNNDINNGSVSISMENIHRNLISIVDKCIPYVEREIKYKQLRRDPWVTSGIKLSIDKKQA